MQKSASMRKRTSPLKFAHLAEKSENGSISNLSTKVSGRTRGAAPSASTGPSPRAPDVRARRERTRAVPDAHVAAEPDADPDAGDPQPRGPCKIFANFQRARSRLYQNEILEENMRLTAFFKLYKICILLHR